MLMFLVSCASVPQEIDTIPSENGSHITNMSYVAVAAKALSKKYGKENVLIAYDIDNTLLAMNQDLGSDQWFNWQTSRKTNSNEKWYPSFDCALQAQGLLYRLGSMRLTHSNVDEIVGELQTDGFPSIAVTSRGPQFRFVTFRELKRNNLDFSNYSVAKNASSGIKYLPYSNDRLKRFSPNEINEYKLIFSDTRPRQVTYEDGIYFTSGQHKGAMLRLLLERHKLLGKIKAVVFVDDSYDKHVPGMIKALKVEGIDLYAYGYDVENENVDEFNNNPKIKAKLKKLWCGLTQLLPSLNDIYGETLYPLKGKDDESGELINCLSKRQMFCK